MFPFDDVIVWDVREISLKASFTSNSENIEVWSLLIMVKKQSMAAWIKW